MVTTIQCSMVKRHQSRSYSYSTKRITQILDNLGWEHEIRPPAVMILSFQKHFPTKNEAIQGRKELDAALRVYHPRIGYRVDAITSTKE